MAPSKSKSFSACDLAFGLCVFVIAATALTTSEFLPNPTPDTDSYLSMLNQTFLQRISGIRTLGYPAFIAFVQLFNPSLSWLAYIQGLVAVAACILFYRSLKITGVPEAGAFAVAMTALVCHLSADISIEEISTDSLGLSLYVVSLSFLIRFIGQTSMRHLALFSLFSFAAYHVRPAYLFVPVFGAIAVIGLWIQKETADTRLSLRKVLLSLLLIVGPLFGYCGLRAAYTGQVGLVAFDGYASQVLAIEFTSGQRRFTFDDRRHEQFLDQVRNCRNLKNVPNSLYAASSFNPWLYTYWYSVNAFDCGERAAFDILGPLTSGYDPRFHVNGFLRNFSRDVFRQAPDLFAVALLSNAWYFLRLTFVMPMVKGILIVTLVLGLFLGARNLTASLNRRLTINLILAMSVALAGSFANVVIFAPLDKRYATVICVVLPLIILLMGCLAGDAIRKRLPGTAR